VLVAAGLLLWLACFALSVKVNVIDGRSGWLLLGASVAGASSADGYPTVRSVGQENYLGHNWALASGLRPGDRLIRLGDANLRGVGMIGFYARAAEQAGPDHWVKVVVERDGDTRTGEWPLANLPGPPWWVALIGLPLGLGIPLLVFLRAPDSRPARLFFFATLLGQLHGMGFAGADHRLAYVWLGILYLSVPVSLYLVARFVQTLPDEPGIPRAGDRVVAVLLAAALLPILSSLSFGTPLPWFVGARALSVFWVVGGLLAIARTAINYRRATPIGRRRVKWLLLGIYSFAVCIGVARAATLWNPFLYWLPPWASLAGILVPLGLLVSVLRFDLFDIDRLFSRTLAVTAAGVALLAAGLFGLPQAANALADVTGISPGATSAALAAALAVAVVPAQHVLRPRIERALFAARHAIDTGVERLLGELEQGESAERLVSLAAERLDAMFHARSCSAYLRPSAATFVPVFARGVERAPAYDAEGPLAAALRGRREVLAGAAAGHVTADARDPFLRAALEAVGAAILVPLHCGDDFAGWIGLGARASGDVYTPTDRALLAAVGSKLSSRLAQLADRAALAESRELQGRLRAYVPGAVAEQVEAGADLGGREQEVTVLFVDVRGYSGFAQGRAVGEVFSAISRYTELVTSIVREAGGAVVEFNGDGMMAVFGAPALLADKAARALRAAREIAQRVGAATGEGGEPLSVGVGIATGSAYVGSIRAADRSIWTALGETTNLAARLQALTRELDAAIAIDEATQRLAGAGATQGFARRPDVAIRGREGSENLYCLPRASGAAEIPPPA
jgi:class 3 adenylate cyclase